MRDGLWRVGRETRPRPDWYAFVKKGDILETPSGDMRMVRDVTRTPSGLLRCVVFAIRRRSWTNRPFTVLCHSDAPLLAMKYVGPFKGRATAACVLVQQAIEEPWGKWDRRITARHAEGCP